MLFFLRIQIYFFSLFQHHVYTFGGCRFLAYPCKATSGSSSYVLQYGNAEASNMKKIENGDIWFASNKLIIKLLISYQTHKVDFFL